MTTQQVHQEQSSQGARWVTSEVTKGEGIVYGAIAIAALLMGIIGALVFFHR